MNATANTQVQTHFSKLAEDGVWASLYATRDTVTSETWSFLIRARRVAQLLQKSGTRLQDVVDIGCGTAPIARSVVAMGANYTGIDFSAAMIEAAGQNVPDLVQQGRARLMVGDADRINLPDQSCDAIVAMGVLEYLTWPVIDTVLKEVHRVLRPGGVAVLTIPKRHHWETVLMQAVTPLRWMWKTSREQLKLKKTEDFERLYMTAGELDSACRRANLPKVDGYHYNLQPLCRPATILAPRFTYFVNRPFESLARVPGGGFLGTGYIGMYRREA